MTQNAWLIPFVPFVSFWVILFFGKRMPKKGAEVGILSVGASLVMSVTMDKTQQRIMLLLPLAFAVIIPSFPAGLIVYWITTNFWTLGQQIVVRKLAPPPEPVVAAAAAATAGAGGGVGGNPRKPPPPPRKKKRRRR